MSELHQHLERRRLISEGSFSERCYRPASPSRRVTQPWQTSVAPNFTSVLRKSTEKSPILQPMVRAQVDNVMAETSKRLEKMSSEIFALKGKNVAMSEELDILRKVRADQQVLAATIETLRFQNAELERDRKKSTQEQEVLVNENKKLLKDLQRARQDLASVEERRFEEVELLRKELSEEREAKISFTAERARIEAACGVLEADLNSCREELGSCRDENAELRNSIQACKAREADAVSAAAMAKAAAAESAAQAEALASRHRRQEEEQPEPECEAGSPPPRYPSFSYGDSFMGGAECSLGPPKSSDSRLRALLSNPGTRTEDLEEAILSVEALVGEARRELSSRQLRERRSAFEKLLNAVDGYDEAAIQSAILEACRTQVDGEDVQKAQARLEELRARSVEERAAKEARDQRARLKETAFMLVKRGDATGLKDLLVGLSAEEQWAAWKDHAGRSLCVVAKDRGNETVCGILESLIAAPPLEAGVGETGLKVSDRAPARQESWPMLDEAVIAEQASSDASRRDAPPCTPRREPIASAVTPVPPTPVTPATPSMGEEGELKQTAFRSVVKDDVEKLTPVLEALPPDVWSVWRNRAGKDLLELSQERGSSKAYSALAKALGLVTELPRELFEERETVWVYIPGDAQPRRASVMEDTPKEADTVLVEYWDGNEPALYLDRCMLRKMAS